MTRDMLQEDKVLLVLLEGNIWITVQHLLPNDVCDTGKSYRI